MDLNQKNEQENDEEHEEDAISLCDLHIRDEESEECSGSLQSDQDPFEFSSRELDHPVGDIVFCGKLIRPKGASPALLRPLQNGDLAAEKKMNKIKKNIPKEMVFSSSERYERLGVNCTNREEGTSISPSVKSPAKGSSGGMVLIGLARVPAGMEISEIRMRQRKQPMPSYRSFSCTGSDGGAHGGASGGGGRRSKKLLEQIPKALACRLFRPETAVKEPLAYNSREGFNPHHSIWSCKNVRKK